MFAFRIGLTIVTLLAAVVLVAVGIGAWRWRHRVAAVETRILAGVRSHDAACATLSPDTLAPPVRRFATRALPDMRTCIVAARLTQEGTFQMG